jgi:hypothetical protein
MKIPEKVKIGGITYDVIAVNKPDKTDKNIDGNIVYSSGIINISNGFDECEDYKKEVLIHEITHGILNFLNIDKDEDFVEKFSKSLYMVIVDNPDLFKEAL